MYRHQKYFEWWGYGYLQYVGEGEAWYWIPGKGTMTESFLLSNKPWAI